MGKYETDRAWSDRFIPQLRSLIGPYLLVPSSLEQDTKEAADLVVLRARDMTVACRVRRHGYAQKYPSQFTLRSKRDNGIKTEFRKVVEGWGDWFFYGHSTADEKAISPWWLIDLSSFRAHLAIEAYREIKILKQGSQSNNGDGTHFHWFRIDSFPAEPRLLVASSEPEPVQIIRHEPARQEPVQVPLDTDIQW